MSFKIASWNVNSLKVRGEQVCAYMQKQAIDVMCLQETKLADDNFLSAMFSELNYQLLFSGQKTYNGVAIISKLPISQACTDIVGLDCAQRRILAVTINNIRIINLYVVNGSEVGSAKYEFKLNWLSKVSAFIKSQLEIYKNVVVLGDFNIAPADIDVYKPSAWRDKILCSQPERELLQQILDHGLVDSFRELNQELQQFSWWDYRQDMFAKNYGLRIDLILNNKNLHKKIKQITIDSYTRAAARPSDHAPVCCEYDL